MTIDPKQFGEMTAEVKNLNKSFDEHIGDFKKSQQETDKRLKAMEDIFRFLKWLLPVLLFFWPLILPFVQKWLLEILFSAETVSQLLTFYSPPLL